MGTGQQSVMLGRNDQKYLPDRSVVLQGKQVFQIFFEGTSIEDIDKDGAMRNRCIRDDWAEISEFFT